MPEASVHEYARPVLRQDDVRRAGEAFFVDAIPVSEPEQLLAQLHFWLGVSGPDVRHAGVALRRREDVGHDSVLLSIEYLAFYAGLWVYDFPAEVNILRITLSICRLFSSTLISCH